jgi:hypothetical protein
MSQGSSYRPEKNMQLRFPLIIASTLFIFAFFTSGCGAGRPSNPIPVVSETVTPAETGAAPTQSPSPTATQAKATEPAALSEVILLSPPQADEDLAGKLESVLAGLSSSAGLKFERLDSLNAGELDQGTRLVVAIAPDQGIEDLAAAAPQVQFIGIGIPTISGADNLTTLASPSSGDAQTGFLAGYLAAMVTPEWRVGVLSPSDTPSGAAARQGFVNGVVYFCGLCRQTYPPFVTYPLYAELPSTASPAEWQGAAQSLVDQAVQTVYLAPGAYSQELAAFFGQSGVQLIAGSPPPAGLQDDWVATLGVDPAKALQDAWASLLAGEGAETLVAPVSLSDVNEEILTPGRMRLLEKMIADLESGYIDPGSPVDQEGINP